MRNQKNLLTAAIPVIALAFSYASGAGTAGMVFLKMGTGARELGMSGAVSAWIDDANAVYWNPAGLENMNLQQVSLMHTQWFEDIAYDNLSYAFPTMDTGTFGCSFSMLSMKSIQGYDWHGKKTELAGASNQLMMWSYANNLNRLLKIPALFGEKNALLSGVTLKYAEERLGRNFATVTGLDFGFLCRDITENLNASLVYRNLSLSYKYYTKKETPPSDLVIGVSYRTGSSLLLAADMNFPSDVKSYAAAGIEYLFDVSNIQSAVRAGYRADSGITFGFGVKKEEICFDYAFG